MAGQGGRAAGCVGSGVAGAWQCGRAGWQSGRLRGLWRGALTVAERDVVTALGPQHLPPLIGHIVGHQLERISVELPEHGVRRSETLVLGIVELPPEELVPLLRRAANLDDAVLGGLKADGLNVELARQLGALHLLHEANIGGATVEDAERVPQLRENARLNFVARASYACRALIPERSRNRPLTVL
jgi:hypothetical protein